MSNKQLKWPVGILLIFWLIFCLLVPTSAFSGNKRMIESQVERLKRLNQRALMQVPNRPANGRIQLKADILPGPAPQKIVIRKTTLKKWPTGFKSSLRALFTEGPAMAALEAPSREAGHRTFRQGLRRYVRQN